MEKAPEFNFDFEREKITFNQFFNSPLKRVIIGVFFKLQKEFVTNISWNKEYYDRLAFMGGKKNKIKKKQIEQLINEPESKESMQFLIDFKLLLPHPMPKDLKEPLPDIKELLQDYEEYTIISGIEFDDDVFSSISSGLQLSVGAIHHFLKTMLDFDVNQSRLQTGLDELQSFPSRTNPSHMLILLDKNELVTKSTAKRDIMYSMTDFTYTFLNKYHPASNYNNEDNNGKIYLDLLSKSLAINKIVAKTAVIGINSKKLLKTLDSQIVLKSTTVLVEKIILRELFIQDYESFFIELERLTSFQEKLDELSNGSELAQQVLKDANMTNNPLPAVFEYLDPFEKPVGFAEEFLTAFSRLYIAHSVSIIINLKINEPGLIFKMKPGEQFFVNLNKWLEIPSNTILLEAISDLVSEADYLVEYYSKEEIELISKNFKEQ